MVSKVVYLGRYPVSSKKHPDVIVVLFPNCIRYFILSARIWISGTNIPRAPLCLGRKRVSQAIGSAADPFHK